MSRVASRCVALGLLALVACAPGLHVAPGGNDHADGSAAAPLATLARAQQVMRATGQRVVILDPGTERLTATLVLDARDDGVSLVACPRGATLDGGGRLAVLLRLDGARGVRIEDLGLTGATAAAVLLSNGGSHALSGLDIRQVGRGVVLSNATLNTISRSRITQVASSGIEAKDDSRANSFDSNTITDVAAHDTTGGGIFLHGASDNLITRNSIARTQGMGIGVLNWSRDTINTGNVIRQNVLRDVDLGATDSGAIYVLGRSQRDTRMVIADNLVDGSGPPAAHTVGIYLDDSTSGALVRGNILRRFGAIGVQVHGGSANRVEANILDLGHAAQSAMLFQSAPADTHPNNRMVDNVVQRNVVLWSGRPKHLYDAITGGHPLISDNVYFAEPGASAPRPSALYDLHPIYGDPEFAAPESDDYAPRAGGVLVRLGLSPVALSELGPP